MSLASTEVQHALEDVLADWLSTPDVARARRSVADALADDAERRHQQLVELGLFQLPVPDRLGGAGGSLADLAVVLEHTGRALLPGDYLPTAAGALILSEARADAAVDAILRSLAGGERRCAVALDSCAGLESGRLTGSAGLVLGGAEADILIVGGGADETDPDRWFLVDRSATGVDIRPRAGLDLTRSLAEVVLTAVEPLAELRGLPSAFPRDVLVTCLASEAAGITGWCRDTAVTYAGVRRQFDRPIGSFQAVQHLCADLAVLNETALSAAWDAASAVEEPEQFELTAAAAGLCGLDAAVEAAQSCIQVLGGIGYTWEHDAHLYLRRALTARMLAGPAEGFGRRLGQLALEGRRRVPAPLAVNVAAEARDRVRRFAAAAAQLPAEEQRAQLVSSGYLVPSWPAPFGLDANPAECLMIDAELAAAGIRVPDLVIANWIVRAIVDHGTAEQRERFVWPTLQGDLTWCQLFSEPEAGSDLASLRMRAVAAPGGWRLQGQKVWTSLAREADWGLALARTEPDAPKRRGITAFLIDMTSPGLTIRPLREATGEARFNEIFFDDVFVPEDCVLGPVNGGWPVATSSLSTERRAIGSRPVITPAMERILAELESTPAARCDWLAAAGSLLGRSMVNDATERRSAVAGLAGAAQGAMPLVSKLVGVRLAQDERRTALLVRGARGALDDGDSRDGVQDYFRSRALSIAGGSTQILLTMLAERVLGLPRGS